MAVMKEACYVTARFTCNTGSWEGRRPLGQPASGCESHGVGVNKTIPSVRYLVSAAQLRGDGKNGKIPTMEAPSKVCGQDVRSTAARPGGYGGKSSRVIVYGGQWNLGKASSSSHTYPVSFYGLLGHVLCFPPAPTSVSFAGKVRGKSCFLPLLPLSPSQVCLGLAGCCHGTHL